MLRSAGTLLFAAVAVRQSAEPPQPINRSATKSAAISVCKPSELPVYVPIIPPPHHAHPQNESALQKHIESGVHTARIELVSAYSKISDKAEIVTNYYDIAKAHTQRSIDYLNEPQNSLQRSGAIAVGALAGFIFAARGGIIKKTVYTTIGGATVASLCYPRQAEEQARIALTSGRKVFLVAYNFIRGVKPGDDATEDSVIKFPTSLNDVKFYFYEWYDETKSKIFPKKK